MRKGLTLIIVVLVLFIAGWFYWKFYFTYSEGNRSGLLQKFSHKGNLFKTYEGELVLNSLTTTTNGPLSAEKFYFSVDQKRVVDKLANAEGKRVVVHYLQKNGALAWRGDTPYIVDSVTITGP
jgi:hypothetical protein